MSITIIPANKIPKDMLKAIPIPIRRGDATPAPRIFRNTYGQMYKVTYTANGGIESLEIIG